jgi:RNA polymerase sigma-70 factor, ECF subfamily
MSDPHHEWFEHLVTTTHELLRAYAVRRVGVGNADDVVAEVFAVAWRRRNERPERVLPWLYGVAHNVVLHERRSFARRARLGRRLRQEPPAPDDRLAKIEVDAVLDSLAPADAEILRLTIWEQLTPSEIAQVLRITPEAARQRLRRARARAQRLHEFDLTPRSQHA